MPEAIKGKRIRRKLQHSNQCRTTNEGREGLETTAKVNDCRGAVKTYTVKGHILCFKALTQVIALPYWTRAVRKHCFQGQDITKDCVDIGADEYYQSIGTIRLRYKVAELGRKHAQPRHG